MLVLVLVVLKPAYDSVVFLAFVEESNLSCAFSIYFFW